MPASILDSNPFRRFARWLHLQWPAGTVEPLPEVDENGQTNLPGVYVVGDLRGIPLLKFALDSGTKAVQRLPLDPGRKKAAGEYDVAILGAGVAGLAAAREAKKRGLSYVVLEPNAPFSTLLNFPKGKPIFTYPKAMTPAGDWQISGETKETLVAELQAQLQAAELVVTAEDVQRLERAGDAYRIVGVEKQFLARFVIIAIGRSGRFRTLDVPGEGLPKVYNRLHDPKDYAGKNVLVVGGGDSALESAIALAQAGAGVTLSYRGDAFARAKPENVKTLQALAAAPQPVILLRFGTTVREIREEAVILDPSGEEHPNDVVFTMLGREAPVDFFRRSGIRLRQEWTKGRIAACAAFVTFCYFLYSWKSGGWLGDLFYKQAWWPVTLADSTSILAISASSPSFWYTLLYSTLIVVFGVRRIRRRRAPYITAQTLTLMAFQVFPLFLLPELILPWLGRHDFLPQGLADALFPSVTYGHGREYWRAYGFILAWPLMVYNVFTDQPLWAWLGISLVQTFVLIPAMIYFWGKGAYCGWICSCGALAETLGDAHRTKMPHGPGWNRLNLAGQIILGIAFVLLAVRIAGWVFPGSGADVFFERIALPNYKWTVDVGLGGILGVGLYFWFSGRVWCRFFCPLAALMHIYARFSRFRIFARKEKCISCNVCTSVCHQGIDVMGFANKGLPVIDPQCVRCSACVHSCPTDVLSFGQADASGKPVALDTLSARPR